MDHLSIRGFLHIEIVHPDPDAAAAFLCATVGGEVVERRLSAGLEEMAEGLRVVHVLVAGVVFQLVRPPEGIEPWHSELAERGPCVHNVTLNVAGIEATREALVAAGATQIIELEAPLGALSDDQLNRAYVMDAREQTGLRFEIVDAPRWTAGEAS